MTAKKYAKVQGQKPAKPLGPQAMLVWQSLSATPKLATEVNAECGPKFTTRQDTLRVTLYYILVFKSQGLVSAHENVETETENAFAGLITA